MLASNVLFCDLEMLESPIYTAPASDQPREIACVNTNRERNLVSSLYTSWGLHCMWDVGECSFRLMKSKSRDLRPFPVLVPGTGTAPGIHTEWMDLFLLLSNILRASSLADRTYGRYKSRCETKKYCETCANQT
jgi:hypothetical protein